MTSLKSLSNRVDYLNSRVKCISTTLCNLDDSGVGTETDPIFTASPAFGITTPEITNWDAAFSWGNHASAGYLTTTNANAVYQTLSNLSTDLTASATKYPSVNAVNTGLALKANINSPTLTGTPLAPTATAGTNTTQIATTAFVTSALTGYVDTTTNQATIAGNKTFTGITTFTANVNITGTFSPTTGSTYDLGTSTNKFANVYSNRFVSNGTLSIISASNAAILFSQTSPTSNVLGGFATTGEFILQAAGTSLTTSTTERLQVYGTSKITGATSIGGNLTLTSIPALGTTATVFLTSNSGVVSSRTVSQVLTDIGAAPNVLTGYTSGAGTVASTDTVLQAIQKLNGNDLLKAPLASPALTGIPTAPTATFGTNTTQIATTAYVTTNYAPLLLTGYTSGAGTVSATDSVFQAIQKLNGNISANTANFANFVDLTTNQATIAGNKGFTGTIAMVDLNVSGTIAPNVNNTLNLGSASNRFAGMYSTAFINTSGVTFGTTSATSGIFFRQGASGVYPGGIFATTGNWWLQAQGAAPTDDTINRLQVAGSVKSTQYRLSALNTAPSSSTDTGVLGEIRVTGTFIYVCTATNTWVRSALATF